MIDGRTFVAVFQHAALDPAIVRPKEKNEMIEKLNAIGLYVHIPFCAKLCHYCDFAKTANFDVDHVKNYFKVLTLQLTSWAKKLPHGTKFTSVFFGGGTPGLFSYEYEPFFAALTSYLAPNAEVTLESNPNNILEPSLKIWRSLGINRISIGVQSFDPMGLKTLTRDHSAREAVRAIDLARSVIPNVNADLIYGWPGQTVASWDRDLNCMIDLGVTHLSLYALTLEGNTPFARAHRRGKLHATPDETQEQCYLRASKVLNDAGFYHEEISNWTKPGFSCKHNWLYWTAAPFVGIGAGAHGYIFNDENQMFGMRYSYPGDLRTYLRECASGNWDSGIVEDVGRGSEEWLMEYVGCSLRTEQGIDLQALEKKGWSFKATSMIENALREGILNRENHRLVLRPADWFRETSWSGIVLDGLKPSDY